jgi:hypothetical protein
MAISSVLELFALAIAALDPVRKTRVPFVVDDVEYRDLKRFLRTGKRLSRFDRIALETFLEKFYLVKGPVSLSG